MTELEVVHIQKVEWVSAEEGKRQCASQTSSRLTFGAGLFPFCPDTEVHQTPQPRHYTPEQNSNRDKTPSQTGEINYISTYQNK
jgi:hypothetical protein